MKQLIRLTESDLRRIVSESVRKILHESFMLSGKYSVYTPSGELVTVYIDSSEPIVKINDYVIDGKEALDAIRKIELFSKGNDSIESAIEQYIYDELR